MLRLLIAYQTAWDFLDNASERGASAGVEDGRQLHRALPDALDPCSPVSEHYRHHPCKEDNGYLDGLVLAARNTCASLPSYFRIRSLVLPGVTRCSIQCLNHIPDSESRDAALRAWAAHELPGERTLSWFELCAAASAFTPHPLLALAAEPIHGTSKPACAHTTYFPWVSLAIAMLDSYVDQLRDSANDAHSYISHYGDTEVAVQRLRAIIARAMGAARTPGNGHRHTIVVASMIAMYLSRESAHTTAMRNGTRSLTSAGGSLTRLLLPALQVWRVVHIQHSLRRRGKNRSATGNQLPPSLRLPRAVQTLALWRRPLPYIQHNHSRHDRRFTIHTIGQPPLVVLSDPDDVKAVLMAPADVLHPGEGVTTITPLIGEQSFMLADEEKHLCGRKAITPAFHAKAVREHANAIADVARSRIASWPRDHTISLHPHLRALTLEVILKHIFVSPVPPEDRLHALHGRLFAMLSIADSTVLPAPLLRHDPRWPIWKRFLRQRAEVDELLYALIDEHRSATGGVDVLTGLSATLNPDGSPMSQRQMRDNIMSLVLAGHETTAAELAWTFQLLAHNQPVQERLLAEIDRDESEEYLNATVLEVLRHRPVFPFAIPRAVVKPIEIGGWTYHPPAHLLGCIYLVHHDPKIYPRPDAFRPERFLDAPPQPHLWVPWGGGRKRCPGAHLAMLEMKTVLREVLSSTTVLPAGRRIERARWRSVIVTPHAGARVVLRPRDRARFPTRAT